MTNISIRLSDDLLKDLQREARRQKKLRSDLIRTALVDYLKRSEQDRRLNQMIREARVAYVDPAIQQEALDIVRDFDEAAPDPDADQPWWK